LTLATYLINLDGSDARLESATRQLRAAGVEFTRVPAFDGRGLDVSQVADYDPRGAMRVMGRPLRGAEIGCYYSHLDCARRFLQGDAEHALVLEDDMQLAPGTHGALGAMLDWLGRNGVAWDMINVGARRAKYTSLLMGTGGHELLKAHYFPMRATGIVWSRTGARSFVEGHRSITAPVDMFFRDWQCRTDRGLVVMPPLVTTTGAESEIDDGGGDKRGHGGRSVLYGLIKQRRLLRNRLRAIRHRLRWRQRARFSRNTGAGSPNGAPPA